MIKTNDVYYSTEISSTDNDKSFLDIKPEEEHNIKTIAGYWDTIFKRCSPEYELTLDECLGEIYGRDEKEFVFDIHFTPELVSIIKKINNESWYELSDQEKKDLLLECVKEICHILGLKEIPRISYFEDMEDICGAFVRDTGEVQINTALFNNPIELIDTIAHELRHTYQWTRACIMETREDQLYKLNFKNYISPIPIDDNKYLFYTDYQDQLVEAEARAFARKFTNMGVV